MTKILAALSAVFFLQTNTNAQYWQQEVNYTIDVTLNDKNHTLRGNLQLEYINNSPDQLSFIWFHLWPNAYRDQKTAFAKQLLKEKDGKDRLKGLKDKGSIDSLNFTVNGTPATIEPHPEFSDVVKLILPASLASGAKVTISTPFFVKLPTYISRMGHIDQSYIICQWYPKPAVYDRKGWHPLAYLDQGEFYSEFGKFNVSITTPSEYIIGATGVMQNEKELAYYKQLGSENSKTTNNKKYKPLSSDATKTLKYYGENIHDFAWYADKDFIIEYDTMTFAPGKIIDVFAYHPDYGNKLWNNATGYIKDAVRKYSSWIGEYPYPVVQAVEGPKNLSSGGMEYPTITLITSPDADESRLDGVITHEVGHNWFYSILASNERDHAWLDEGINTYYQFRYEHAKYKTNSIFGDAIPKEIREKPVEELEGMVYMALAEIPMDREIDLPAEEYANKDEYGTVVYLKTAIWMYLIELMEGREPLDKGLKAYFEKWKFKHPYPEDFRAVMEEAMGKKLDTYFDLLKKKGSLK